LFSIEWPNGQLIWSIGATQDIRDRWSLALNIEMNDHRRPERDPRCVKSWPSIGEELWTT
jgi:hypothetical protein